MKYILIIAITVFIFISCNEKNSKNNYSASEHNYLMLIEELHKIECNKVKEAGIEFNINDTNIYTFRTIAFETIMTNKPDLKLIAYYEEINQKLASIEYFMNDEEKTKFKNDFISQYLKPCNY
jgi:hypothetical protein